MFAALCLSLTLAAPPPAAPPAGPPPMTQALEALARLQPWLANPVAFRDPANQKAITQALDTLARLEHPWLSAKGPSAAGVGELFGRQAAAAQSEFARGRTEAARYYGRSLSQLCVGCHAREPTKDFADAEKVVAKANLPPLQQAQFFATTRQLDRALELWKTELAKPVTLDPELYEQLDALRLALRALVPMRDDPRAVRALLVPQLTRAELPEFVRVELKAWEKDTKDWEAERFIAKGKTTTELFARGKALVTAAKVEGNPTAQPMQFIKLLRAAAYLDEVLRREPGSAQRPELLYLLGLAHTTVADTPLWMLEWMYLEACIREAPHTKQAAACAARLRARSLVLWNHDRDIPIETWNVLKELLLLAAPEGKPAPK